ncbi:MAG TPA: PH domain-containing protein [Candidatus Paceibacterota bacterium]|nr:PH domain-containing protein [Candidatus Paceibacterota bacterium]
MDKAQNGMQVAHQPFENDRKHRLGHRAFTMFFFSQVKLLLLLILITVGVWYLERYIPPDYAIWGPFAFQIALYVTIAYFLFVLLRTYLQYRYYTYYFTEEAFMMTSGYMVRAEVAALYHQIQNVNILRTPIDRMIGVSRIVILMTGDKLSPQNQIVLPGVGRTKAKLVQRELLTRARKHFNGSA